MLDLGDTLVHGDKPIEHVPEALGALAALRTAEGVPLPLALVSDYTMLPPDAPPGEVARRFDEYVALVRGYGLLPAFEPIEQRVTISTQAGKRKPDAAIFRLALQRLGLSPDLSTAMFITEDRAHVSAARVLGMTAWQYGLDFHDWREAPPLVAHALADDIARFEQARGASAESRYRKALEDNAAIAAPGAPLAPGQTHVLEEGPDGTPRPKRKRFSLK